MRRFQRNVGSHHPHRNAHVRLREGGGIVDAIPNHDDRVAPLLLFFHDTDFVLGQQFCLVRDPKGRGQCRCGAPVVTGQQLDLADAERPEPLDRARHFWTNAVCHSQYSDEFPFALDQEQGFPLPFKGKRDMRGSLLTHHAGITHRNKRAIDTRPDAHSWNGFKLPGELQCKPCGFSLVSYCFSQRVLRVTLDTCGKQKDFFGRYASERDNIRYLWAASGDSSRFVNEHDVGPRETLQVLAPFHQQPMGGCRANGGEHRNGRGQGKGTRACHDQDRCRSERITTHHEGEQGKRCHDWQKVRRETIGNPLHRSAMGFRFLDHRDHPSKGGISSHLGRPDAQAAKLSQGRGKDPTSGFSLDRHGLSGNGRLIERRLATHDFPIDWYGFTWAHDNRLPNRNSGNGNNLLTSSAFHARRLGSKRGEALHRLT